MAAKGKASAGKKKAKGELAPATVMKPALLGVAALAVVQVALRMFLGA